MSVVTSLVLVYRAVDDTVVDALQLDPEHTENQRFIDVTEAANEAVVGPSRKMLQLRLAATAVSYFNVEQLVARIEKLPWKEPESVMLLVLGEDELRPAVWGFADARSFRSLAAPYYNKPLRFVRLVERVPS